MKRILLTFVSLALLAASLVACQAAAQPTTISEQDAGKTIALRTGDTLRIELEGNPTTGYNWIATSQEPKLLDQIGESNVTPESDRIGAPGTIVLQFSAVAPGQTILRLEYKRAWETDVAPLKTFEVAVTVS